MKTLRRTRMTTRLSALIVVTSAALLAACATRPAVRNAQLDQARETVHSLEHDPDAQRVAADQLRDARHDLQRANAASAQHRTPAEVTYLAYLADREAEAGKAYTDAFRTRQALAKGNEERRRILLDARNREIQQARIATQTARVAARTAHKRMLTTQNQLQQERRQLSALKARETARGLQLTLASNLLFNNASATLQPGATLQLGQLVDFMRRNPKARIIVEGYTDSVGPAAYNQQLSQARAQAVAGAIEAGGISAGRIQAIGRGESFPVASNATAAGRQQNRRVDIILSDMAGRFAQAATERRPMP